MRALIRSLARPFSTAASKPPIEANPKFTKLYKEGLQLESSKRLRDANQSFRHSLEVLKTERLHETDQAVQIYRKMARNEFALCNHKETAKILRQIVQIVRSNNSPPQVVYSHYNNLFLHYLRTDLRTAILFGKALLSDSERHLLPTKYEKLFQLNLGTAYLLQKNYIDAKSRLRTCINMLSEAEFDNKIMGYALNNLGVAYWWHKHPSFDNSDAFIEPDRKEGFSESDEQSQKTYPDYKIDQDFKEAANTFKLSLYYLQDVKNMTASPDKLALEQLLDESTPPVEFLTKHDPMKHLLFSNPASSKPLLNMSEMIFCTNPKSFNEAMYWFYTALKHAQKYDHTTLLKCKISLAIFSSAGRDFAEAQKLLQSVIRELEGTDSMLMVMALERLAKMLDKNFPNRRTQVDKLFAEAYNKADNIPYWQHKFIHVAIMDPET